MVRGSQTENCVICVAGTLMAAGILPAIFAPHLSAVETFNLVGLKLDKEQRKDNDRRDDDRRKETVSLGDGEDRRLSERRGYADRRAGPLWKFRWLKEIISKQLSGG